MINFKRHFNSSKRISYQTINDKNFYKKINFLFCKILKKKMNFNKINDLKKLEIEDLKKIDFGVRKRFQKKFVEIIYPELKKMINYIFDKNINIRVSCQAKFKWEKDYDKKKFHNPIYKNLSKYSLILSDDLYYKPTPPHQDLSNNGFRSSSVIIFYFQITPVSNKSSLLAIPQNYKKSRILPTYVTKDNYPNAIKSSIVRKLKFKKPNQLKKNKILILDGITPHASTKNSEIPRIALNVKVHPISLNYLYKIYNRKKKFKRTNSRYENLKILENDLIFFSNKNEGLLYELSILNCLQGKFKDMKKNLSKAFLKKPKNFELNKYIAGGLLRKTLENVSQADIIGIYKKNPKVVKFSCADAINRTINESI